METTPRGLPESLATLIAALPEEERVVLTLHYVQNRTVVEIATTLSVAPRSVEAVLKAGKARLSAALGLG